MSLAVVLKLLAVLVLVAANAFFVAAEFALVGARRTRIRELAAGGDRLARSVEAAQKNLDRSISGTQLGITLASLGLGWIGEPAIAQTLHGAFASLAPPWSGIMTHGTAAALAFALITFLHIVLGELAPKSLALLRPETVSRAVAGPLNAFNAIVTPFIWVLNGAANGVLRAAGMSVAGARERVHSSDEIQMLVRQSLAEGAVEDDEEAMIHGVFELTHTVAREVMTPRPDIVAFHESATLDEVLNVAAESGFSRFPVYRSSIDEVTGVVLVKDLLGWLRDGDDASFSLSEVAREPYFVPDSKAVDDLIADFRASKLHLAIVVDEFGGTDGIVTLEDLLEEIVGDIYDEHDAAEADIRILEDGRILLDGGADFTDVLEEFDLPAVEEEDDDYDTIAGYVIAHLGRIPEPGERVRLGRGEFEVLETHEQRVTSLELRLDVGEEVTEGGDGADEATDGEEA
ncbi:MAG: hemolysin family protein [Gemmatimonadota bacterium]